MRIAFITAALVVIGVVGRLIPHAPNVVPVMAIALLAGFVLPRGWSMFVPLVAMIISDIFFGFHALIGFTWGAMIIAAFFSSVFLKNRKLGGATVVASLAASVFFFLVTNFGVWLEGRMYPLTLPGLVACYEMAIPFFRNSLVGDLFYTVTLFSGYEAIRLATRRIRLGINLPVN